MEQDAYWRLPVKDYSWRDCAKHDHHGEYENHEDPATKRMGKSG